MNEVLSPIVIFRALVLLLSSLVWWSGSSARAQSSSELSAMYGRGVHAYFANRTGEAEELLSQVINAGSTDPRVYYFRAMTRMSCGRQDEAEQDMQVGASFEARDPGNRYAISKALERVQGVQRRTLESVRHQARMDRLQQRQRMTRERYEQLQRREPEVLRREMPVPLEDLVEPSLKAPGATAPVAPTPAPTTEPAPAESEPTPPQPVPPAEPADEDPFGGEPAADDVFGEPSAPAAEPTPPQEPAESAAPEVSPFGEPEPTEDSEESPPPAEEPDEEDPFASSSAVDEPASLAPTPSNDAELAESDRLESGQLVGVLSRVATSVLPWRGIELPSLPSAGLGASDEPANIALGPIEGDSAVTPASADEPTEPGAEPDDFFGESEESTPPQPAEESFGEDGGAQSPSDSGEAEQPPAEEPISEDPFGEF